WALAVLSGPALLGLPYLPAPVALPGAFLAPGLMLAAMIGRRAARRGTDAAAPEAVRGAGLDRQVVSDTVEQLVLALAVWPFVALTLGGAAAIALGLSFALMRLLFWAGCHRSPLLRSLGFAGTFCPTVLAGFWALIRWAI
ncbi:MAG: MAPEG family protein, partial [Pseudodonghicola sp.]